MSHIETLSFRDFLRDIRSVVMSPSRRFALIQERKAWWGSLALLIIPAYFGFYFAGGVYFTRDPFPGYSFLPPLVATVAAIYLKLIAIHLSARLFLGKAGARQGRSSFSDLVVVYGYTGVPALLATLLALAIFLLLPQQIAYVIRNLRVISVSVLVGLGIALFIWNLILVVLALRTVYAMRDLKIVASLIMGSVLMIVPAISTLWIVAPARIEFAYVQPIYSNRILRFLASDPTSTSSRTTRIDVHVDRLAYRLRSPEHFELVVFMPNTAKLREGGQREGMILGTGYIVSWNMEGAIVGRIVGLPGDTVALVRGKLFINGQAWDEPYLAPEFRSEVSLPPTTLGPSRYLILPENRTLIDGMKGDLVVDRSQIGGRQTLSRWPLGWLGLSPTVFRQAQPAAPAKTP
jgi:hypothetical protein